MPKILVLLLALVLAPLAQAQTPAPDVVWGVNGHPLVSYPDVSFAAQIDLVKAAGLTAYRVDVSSDDAAAQDRFARLLALAHAAGVTLLPVLTPPLSLEKEEPAALAARARVFAQTYTRRFGGQVKVWELGNELENHAILRPCDVRDDGTRYPCDWGPAGGVEPSEYHPGRWAKVSAVLKGLSEGARAGDAGVRRAIGTAGWGHTGAFDRMAADGVEWEISVWHLYGIDADPDWAMIRLARFGKPIWITEFNAGDSAALGEEKQAQATGRMVARIKALAAARRIEAAFFYELLDEPYWSGAEASMGAVALARDGKGPWRVARRKPVFEALRSAIQAPTP